MTLPHDVRRLAPDDAGALEAFLDALPRSQLYLRAAGAAPATFVGAFSGDRLDAVTQSSAPPSLVVAGDPAGLSAIARDTATPRAPWRVMVGRDADALAWLAAEAGADAVSRRHRYLVLDALPAGEPDAEEVERATAKDFDTLVDLSFAFHRDDDPSGAAPRESRAVAARTRARIAAGSTFVLRRAGLPVFMADVGVEEPSLGALLGGIVTHPEWRGRGIARAGLPSLCRRLFARGMPTVALHVAEENAAARGLYAVVGFREIDVFRVAYARAVRAS